MTEPGRLTVPADGSAPLPQVVVLHGGSSSGKTTIARALQELLPGLWLTFGTDTFVEALPGRGDSPRADIAFRADGTVAPGPVFRARERAWRTGLAAMARAGAPVLLDEILLAGGAGQAAWAADLDGLDVVWIGVRCAPDIAAAREAARGDRITGMARDQARRVHEGMRYDLEVDTGAASADRCARQIVDALHRRTPPDSRRPSPTASGSRRT